MRRAINAEKSTGLQLDEEMAEHLWVEKDERWRSFVTSTDTTVTQIPNKPPYLLAVANEEMLLGFYDGHGSLRGLIKNEAASATSWAESRIDAIFEEGREVVIRSGTSGGRMDQASRSTLS